MKIRIGFISEDKASVESLKKDFPEAHVYSASNVMDFYQVIGTNKIEVILVAGGDKVAHEFASYYSYLRQKPQFKSMPIAVFCDSPLVSNHALTDPLVRSYSLSAGFFVPLISFMSINKTATAPIALFKQEQINEIFCAALAENVGQSQKFAAKPASDDEAHAEFLAQKTDEVSCNLMWIKYSARILIEKSEDLLQSVESLPESEQEKVVEQIIDSVLHNFNENLSALLRDEGALFFAHTDALPGPEKAPYLKKAKPASVAFTSPTCTFLVEFIHYF